VHSLLANSCDMAAFPGHRLRRVLTVARAVG
jgi:hypothetical protein